MKAVLLCRVSTEKEEQETSIDRQLARLEEIAKRRSWEVVATFTEQESGRTMNRRAVQEALELVRRRRAGVIVVDHLFRFGRNAKEMLETVDALSAMDGALYEADHELDTTGPLGRLVFTILAAVGEFYVRDGSRKIREGQARARANGKRIGRKRTIDYSLTDRARDMRSIMTSAGTHRYSWQDIADELGGTRAAWARRLSRAS